MHHTVEELGAGHVDSTMNPIDPVDFQRVGFFETARKRLGLHSHFRAHLIQLTPQRSAKLLDHAFNSL